MQWVVGILFLVHGIGHSMGFLASWTGVDVGFSDAPWLLGTDVRVRTPVGRIWGLLWLVAALGWISAGVLVISGGADWERRAIFSALLSLVSIIPWWRAIPAGPKLAVAFDAVVLIGLLLPWGQHLADRIG